MVLTALGIIKKMHMAAVYHLDICHTAICTGVREGFGDLDPKGWSGCDNLITQNGCVQLGPFIQGLRSGMLQSHVDEACSTFVHCSWLLVQFPLQNLDIFPS